MARRLSRKGLLFALILVACVAGGATSIALAVARSHGSHPPASVEVTEGATLAGAAGPQLLFRNGIDDKSFGKLAVAPLSNPDAKRALAGLTCDRVYYAAGRGLCLTATGSFTNSYRAKIFDAHFDVLKTLTLPGIPSRARVSADGRLGALTVFVNGDSYDPGNFSTRTRIVDMRSGKMLADLEQFTVTKDGERFDRRNFNFWGVTFARGDDRFYATLGSGSETYLVVGSLKARTLRVIYSHLECPSLSPDETRIAFKRSTNSHGSWRLWVLDLKTMRAHPLAEAASVDDQVEWRDDRSVLYWRGGDIWVVPSDGGGSPRKLVTAGSSPTVVRTG